MHTSEPDDRSKAAVIAFGLCGVLRVKEAGTLLNSPKNAMR